MPSERASCEWSSGHHLKIGDGLWLVCQPKIYLTRELGKVYMGHTLG